MKASFLHLFRVSASTADLEFVGTRDGDELLDGALLAGDRKVGQVIGGVACFCDDNWPAEELTRIMTPEWLAMKWRDQAADAGPPVRGAFCDELAALDGVVVEIATGPGGGNMPGVLQRNRRAMLIANDTSLGVLSHWHEFIRGRNLADGICFAAFDARTMVLRDRTVAAISGIVAFGNIGRLAVFHEAFRVLQPGGALYSCDMIVDSDDWRQLPETFRAQEEERSPGFARGIIAPLKGAGFRIEHREMVAGRALTAEEDGIQARADEHGVTLHVVFEYVKARRPAEQHSAH